MYVQRKREQVVGCVRLDSVVRNSHQSNMYMSRLSHTQTTYRIVSYRTYSTIRSIHDTRAVVMIDGSSKGRSRSVQIGARVSSTTTRTTRASSWIGTSRCSRRIMSVVS